MTFTVPPTGFHGLLGLFFAAIIKSKYKYFRLGIVWGSVMPDLDLIGSVLIFILNAGNIELSIAFHRSVTHSLIVISFLLTLAILGYFFSKNMKIKYSPFILGMICAMLIHVTLDMFYFAGVTLFWPLQPFDQKITIIPFTYDDLPPTFNSLAAKVIATLDGYFEIVYYLVFIFIAKKYQTDNDLVFTMREKVFEIRNWLSKLRYFCYFLIFQLIFFLILAILSIQWIPVNLNTFIVLLYIPLIPVFVLSGILPLLMHKTVYSLGRS